jgi:multidrug resistance protein, MATE family
MNDMTELRATPADGARGLAMGHGWMDELRALLVLGWPLVVAQLAQNALSITDVVMLGWLGPDALASATLANALFFSVMLFGVGVTGAVAPLVAQALGAGKLRAVRRTVRQGMWVAICLAALLIPIVWFVRPIYVSIGQDPELSAMAEIYIHAACWTFLPAFMIIVLRSFLSAMGATRVVLVITLAGVGVNAALDYALIFGNWGFPRLELAGAGIATSLVNVVMLGLMAGYVVTHRRYRRYHIFGRFHVPDWYTFGRIWQLGLPLALMLLAEVGLFTFASLMQGWIGRDQVAAHAIALQLSSFAFMVPLGLAQATTVRVGLSVGAGSGEGVRKAGWVALGLTLAFMTSSMALLLMIPGTLAGLFLDPSKAANTAPLALAVSYLFITAVFQVFDGTQATMAAALRGLNDTSVPMVIAIIGYWGIGFPTAWFLGFQAGLGGIGIWWGLAAGLAFVATSLVIRFALRERLGLMARATRHG